MSVAKPITSSLSLYGICNPVRIIFVIHHHYPLHNVCSGVAKPAMFRCVKFTNRTNRERFASRCSEHPMALVDLAGEHCLIHYQIAEWKLIVYGTVLLKFSVIDGDSGKCFGRMLKETGVKLP